MPPAPYRDLEFLPEPEDPQMLPAIDPDAPGYPPEAYGATPEQASACRDAANTSSRREIERPWGILMAMCLISALLLTYPQITSLFAGALTPNS